MFCSSAFASSAGVILGSPTGVSVNHFIKADRSVDAALDYNLGSNFHLHGTYLFHKPKSVKLFGQVMGWYYGIGGRLKNVEKKDDEDEFRIGARGSTGLYWNPRSNPFEFFIEGALVMNIIPGTSVDIDAALGARYNF